MSVRSEPEAYAKVIMLCCTAVALLLLHKADLVFGEPVGPAPFQAAAAGYAVRTYSSTFSKETIDLENTGRPGFQWYPTHFFSQPAAPPESLRINTDGSVVLGNQGLDASLATAAPTRAKSGWVGAAFGGGAYIEATLKFDPENTAREKPKSWPAFWSLSIEHCANLDGQQWLGQAPGYVHFIEPDFFEYDVWSFSPRHYYGGAIHAWYGKYKTTCPGRNFCGVSNAGGGGTRFSNFKVQPPPETDYRMFHKFGFLWAPATPTAQGYAQYYFDGKPTEDKVTWDLYTSQPPPPGLAPWTFGVIDQQHLVLIISTGLRQPVTVESVSVWQSSPAKNLRK